MRWAIEHYSHIRWSHGTQWDHLICWVVSVLKALAHHHNNIIMTMGKRIWMVWTIYCCLTELISSFLLLPLKLLTNHGYHRYHNHLYTWLCNLLLVELKIKLLVLYIYHFTKTHRERLKYRFLTKGVMYLKMDDRLYFAAVCYNGSQKNMAVANQMYRWLIVNLLQN